MNDSDWWLLGVYSLISTILCVTISILVIVISFGVYGDVSDMGNVVINALWILSIIFSAIVLFAMRELGEEYTTLTVGYFLACALIMFTLGLRSYLLNFGTAIILWCDAGICIVLALWALSKIRRDEQ